MIKTLEIKTPFSNFLPVVFPLLCVAGLYISYRIARKIPVIYQVAKFILVGGFNTLVDWGVLSLMIFIFRKYFFINSKDTLIQFAFITIAFYSLFKSISFIIAGTNSYFWNKFWTFKRETTEGMGREFSQFLVITFIGFLLNVGIASAIFRYIGPIDGLTSDQWGIAAAVVATFISMFWNFVGYKFIVFDQKTTPISG